MDELTPRQAEVLLFVKGFIERLSMPPTRKDICDYMGFNSPNAAETFLRILEPWPLRQ